jgi:hypothetical protein
MTDAVTIDRFGRLSDVVNALLGVWLICVCIAGSLEVLEKAYFVLYPQIYADPDTGCQLKAVYRDGKLIGFNPVWTDDNALACSKRQPIDLTREH